MVTELRRLNSKSGISTFRTPLKMGGAHRCLVVPKLLKNWTRYLGSSITGLLGEIGA